jgi:hypothetical protein
MTAMLALACGTSKSTVEQPKQNLPPKAAAIDAPPAAVRTVDAPGLNVEDLTARLRDAMSITGGVIFVDELSVRAELAACTEAPCPEVVADKYRSATFVVSSSVSKVGAVFLASVRVQEGARELSRATAQASDARLALENAGYEAGTKLRAALVSRGAAEIVRDETPVEEEQ